MRATKLNVGVLNTSCHGTQNRTSSRSAPVPGSLQINVGDVCAHIFIFMPVPCCVGLFLRIHSSESVKTLNGSWLLSTEMNRIKIVHLQRNIEMSRPNSNQGEIRTLGHPGASSRHRVKGRARVRDRKRKSGRTLSLGRAKRRRSQLHPRPVPGKLRLFR
jgi:hypothetical protein